MHTKFALFSLCMEKGAFYNFDFNVKYASFGGALNGRGELGGSVSINYLKQLHNSFHYIYMVGKHMNASIHQTFAYIAAMSLVTPL